MKTPTPDIRQSLDARLLDALPALSDLDLTAQDVAWPNAAFTPNPDRLYLRPVCLYGETTPASLGPDGFELLRGVYQVGVLDVQGAGLSRAERCAAGLVDAFRSGTVLDCPGYSLRIRAAWQGAPLVEDGRLLLPVSASWTCYAQK